MKLVIFFTLLCTGTFCIAMQQDDKKEQQPASPQQPRRVSTRQRQQAEILLGGSIAATVACAGMGLSQRYSNSKECERLQKELVKITMVDCANLHNDHSNTFTFYRSFPDHAQDTMLGTLVAEFDIHFQQKNRPALFAKRNQISFYVAEQKSLLF